MSPARMLKIESGIRVVLAFHEAFNHHDVSGMMQCINEDCIFENSTPAPAGTAYSGKDAILHYWQNFFRDSPHAHIEIEEIFSAGFRCVMRWKYIWKDEAGNEGFVRRVDIYQIMNNLICEQFSYVKG